MLQSIHFVNGTFHPVPMNYDDEIKEKFFGKKNIKYMSITNGGSENDFEVILDQQGLTIEYMTLKIVGDSSNPRFTFVESKILIKPSTVISKKCATTQNYVFCLMNDRFDDHFSYSFVIWHKKSPEINVFNGYVEDPETK